MILVTGATGRIGRHVVQHLRGRGAELKAMVRAEERGRALGVPYVVADLNDPGTLAPALAGVRRLLLNGPVDEAMVRQQSAAIDAAIAAGVTQIVRVSAAGSSTTSDRAINRWHGELDDRLEQSGIPSVLLRPTFFTQNLLNSAQTVRSEGRLYGAFGAGRLAFIDCRDIAECAAVVLMRATPPRGVFALTGPEALSFADVAVRLSTRLGRPVTYVDRPVDEVVAAMTRRGMASSIADSFGKMMQSFARGGASAITSTVEELVGRAPRTVDAFLDDHLEQFR
jgi:uncharacterized protein YbjT (DUF2867 family)